MAAAAAAALLDELMGRNRNVLPNEKPKELNWEDPEVCLFLLLILLKFHLICLQRRQRQWLYTNKEIMLKRNFIITIVTNHLLDQLNKI